MQTKLQFKNLPFVPSTKTSKIKAIEWWRSLSYEDKFEYSGIYFFRNNIPRKQIHKLNHAEIHSIWKCRNF